MMDKYSSRPDLKIKGANPTYDTVEVEKYKYRRPFIASIVEDHQKNN